VPREQRGNEEQQHGRRGGCELLWPTTEYLIAAADARSNRNSHEQVS
jgi:hypothetical protein